MSKHIYVNNTPLTQLTKNISNTSADVTMSSFSPWTIMSHTPPSQLAGPMLPLQGLRHIHLSGASCWAKVTCGKGLGWFKMMVVMMIMMMIKNIHAAYVITECSNLKPPYLIASLPCHFKGEDYQ